MLLWVSMCEASQRVLLVTHISKIHYIALLVTYKERLCQGMF